MSLTAKAESFTVASVARLYRDGSLTPTEVVDSVLKRVESTEPMVRAYVTVCREEALSQAKAAERRLGQDRDPSPLCGIPVSVKDIIDVRGVKSAAGSEVLGEYAPLEDATVVSRLRAAGAIILGKTTTHEFALGVQTPPTRNPWNLSRMPGGSSGGSAAALAAGSALAALGTDTAGSVRIPSALCGTVGLKPTFGRVSRRGLIPASWSLDHIGPMAKTVEDCALLLSAIAGEDDADPTTADRPSAEFATSLEDGIDGLRIGIPTNHFFDRLDRGVRRAVNEAVEVIQGLGASMEHFTFPMLDELEAAATIIDSAETSAYHEEYIRTRAHRYREDSRAYIEDGFFIPAVRYVQALRMRGEVFREAQRALKRYDAVVAPTVPVTAPPYGADRVYVNKVAEGVAAALCRLTLPFNFTGNPSLSIPCGFDTDGLPVGLQIAGRMFDESTVLKVGRAYESATGWHDARPDFA